MIEQEIMSLLTTLKETHKTYESAARAMGVGKNTFYSWLKEGRGIKDQVLFGGLDMLGVHLVTPFSKQENKATSENDSGSQEDVELLRKIDVLEAQKEGLSEQVKLLYFNNQKLQAQVENLTSILSDVLQKKDSDHTFPNDIAKIS